MTIQSHTITFGYRAAALIIHEDQILLKRSEHDSFWSLPGGKVEFFEASNEALVREMQEEAGIQNLQVLRLVWVVENFFKNQGNSFHDIEFYYLCKVPASSTLLTLAEFTAAERHLPGSSRLLFRWFPRTEESLNHAPILPVFLKTALIQLPDRIFHIVNKES